MLTLNDICNNECSVLRVQPAIYREAPLTRSSVLVARHATAGSSIWMSPAGKTSADRVNLPAKASIVQWEDGVRVW